MRKKPINSNEVYTVLHSLKKWCQLFFFAFFWFFHQLQKLTTMAASRNSLRCKQKASSGTSTCSLNSRPTSWKAILQQRILRGSWRNAFVSLVSMMLTPSRLRISDTMLVTTGLITPEGQGRIDSTSIKIEMIHQNQGLMLFFIWFLAECSTISSNQERRTRLPPS